MGKKRLIDSQIRRSRSFGGLSFRQRDLWQGMIEVAADDQGRMQDDPNFIRSEVWRYDDIPAADVEADITILADMEFIYRYQVRGEGFIQIINWWKYQPLEWAAKSEYPAPPNWIDRVRYHGKNNADNKPVIITVNWDKAGGFVGSQLPSELPSELPSLSNGIGINMPVDGSGIGSSSGNGQTPTPATSGENAENDASAPTVLEKLALTDAWCEKVVQQVTGWACTPPKDRAAVFDVLRATRLQYDTEDDFTADLRDYFTEAHARYPHSPGTWWITEWFATGNIPDRKGGKDHRHDDRERAYTADEIKQHWQGVNLVTGIADDTAWRDPARRGGFMNILADAHDDADGDGVDGRLDETIHTQGLAG